MIRTCVSFSFQLIGAFEGCVALKKDKKRTMQSINKDFSLTPGQVNKATTTNGQRLLSQSGGTWQEFSPTPFNFLQEADLCDFTGNNPRLRGPNFVCISQTKLCGLGREMIFHSFFNFIIPTSQIAIFNQSDTSASTPRLIVQFQYQQ
ncbi:hypothetical protein OXYTRIMIC_494 [Oxytricha trifallax]|uniref:Uncharacterized protein n=1 Tax=Oxytricha trifallax TaxID=1172189 RepID=A0A073HZW6_9SPIT|nr:hypothetical protein OXYTRIMIC_494 [Oxytricha trifallax]